MPEGFAARYGICFVNVSVTERSGYAPSPFSCICTHRAANGRRVHSFGGLLAIEALRIGTTYQTTYGTLWKDGTFFPRGTRVLVVGLHLVEGFCVQFPAEVDGQPLETWEDWAESDFLAPNGEIESPAPVSQAMLTEAREVLRDAEDGCHLHFHEGDD